MRSVRDDLPAVSCMAACRSDVPPLACLLACSRVRPPPPWSAYVLSDTQVNLAQAAMANVEQHNRKLKDDETSSIDSDEAQLVR